MDITIGSKRDTEWYRKDVVNDLEIVSTPSIKYNSDEGWTLSS